MFEQSFRNIAKRLLLYHMAASDPTHVDGEHHSPFSQSAFLSAGRKVHSPCRLRTRTPTTFSSNLARTLSERCDRKLFLASKDQRNAAEARGLRTYRAKTDRRRRRRSLLSSGHDGSPGRCGRPMGVTQISQGIRHWEVDVEGKFLKWACANTWALTTAPRCTRA